MSLPLETAVPYLGPALLELVPPALHAQLVSAGVAKVALTRDEIFTEDNPGTSVGVILQGWVSLEHGDNRGDAVTTAVCGPGSLVNDTAALGSRSNTPSVRALTEVRYRLVPAADFRRLLSTRPDLGQAVAAALSHRLREAVQARREHLSMSAHERVARAMVQLAEPVPDGVGWRLRPMITRQVLCSLSGTGLRNLENVYRELRESGVIAHRGRTLDILDMTELRARAGLPPA